MTKCTVTGKTFEHRDLFKLMKGEWNNDIKAWDFYHVRDVDLKKLQTLVGCVVTVHDDPSPMHFDESYEFISFDYGEEYKPTKSGKTTIFGDDPTYFNYFKDKNPISFFGFSSLSKIIDFVERIPESIRTEKRNYRNAGWQTDQPGWHGTPSMDAAIDLARYGWKEGADEAQRIVEKLDAENAQQKRKKHSVAGGSVNVGRMLSGNPSHMRKRQKLDGKKVVTLFVESVMVCTIESAVAIKRAAIVTAVADIIESKGYSCEIIVVCSASHLYRSGSAYQFAINVKPSGEKININDVVFSLGHPSFFRRIMFAANAMDENLRSVWSSMGMPDKSFNETKDNEYYIKGMIKNLNSLDDIFNHIVPEKLKTWIKNDDH